MNYGKNEDRNKEIVTMRGCGETYGKIANKYGITPSRVKRICDMQRLREKYSSQPSKDMQYVIVMPSGIKSICVKEILAVQDGSSMVLWRNPMSQAKRWCDLSEVNVLATTCSYEWANNIIDDMLGRVESESNLHKKAIDGILQSYK